MRGAAIIPAWRSLLFVGADRSDRIAKIAQRGADAIILDLEDAVPATAAKASARAALPETIDRLVAVGQTVVVRINSGWRNAMCDLDAAVRPGVAAIMVPGCEQPSQLQTLAEVLGEWETERALAPASIGIIALVESAAGLERVAAIADAPRVIGLALGTEDLALDMGVPPTTTLLDLPSRRLAITGRARGLGVWAVPISIADYANAEAYRHACTAARAYGVDGAICIHPAQVAIANAVFSPGDEELGWARRILRAWEKRGDSGVIAVDGRMIDLPVVERARRMIAAAG